MDQVYTKQAICKQIARLKECPFSKYFFMHNKNVDSSLLPIVSWDNIQNQYLLTTKYSDCTNFGTTPEYQPYPIVAKNKNSFYIVFQDFQGHYKHDLFSTEEEIVDKLLDFFDDIDTICAIGSKNQPLEYSADLGFWFHKREVMS